ncbi:MAG: peptidoglycan-associated lipoprotein Pal [Rhodospirillaceae bacterium]|nr:peptidoglycan-associated lipoprotein Pal [Rhodospirillaceae bacterium]
MKLRTVAAVAAMALLAACSTKKTEVQATAPAAAPPPPAAAKPTGPAPDSLEYFNTVVGNTVQFDFDRYDLDAEDQTRLRAQAQWLNQYANRTLTVEGHCDERGTREYNLGLGERRANAVRQYLISQGVAAGRVKTISYGKERPVCVSSDDACYARNRRGVSAVQ